MQSYETGVRAFTYLYKEQRWCSFKLFVVFVFLLLYYFINNPSFGVFIPHFIYHFGYRLLGISTADSAV